MGMEPSRKLKVRMEVLAAMDVAPAVLKLIETAQNFVVLVSPYYGPWKQLQTVIDNTIAKGIPFGIYIRHEPQYEELWKRLYAATSARKNLQVGRIDRLHAKFYLNESEAIVTSLNLLESSALDSWEVSIRIRKDTDADAYKSLLENAYKPLMARLTASHQRLISEQSLPKPPEQAIRPPLPGVSNGIGSKRRKPSAFEQQLNYKVKPAEGHCLRCRTSIAVNPDKPLCPKCFQAWVVYANPTYTEAYCHECGKTSPTSMAKPLCTSCFRAS